MLEKTFKITNQTGLDAKMSSLIVSKSSKYTCKINLIYNQISVDLKSILGVMSLSICKGELLKVVCDGVDEEEAINKISKLIFESKLGKEH